MPIPPFRVLLTALFLLASWPFVDPASDRLSVASAQTRLPSGTPAIVFVSRAIPPNGTVYWNVPKDMPGVGPYSRFRVAAPGRLLVLEPSGSLRVLVDGSNPTAASLNLIDVNAPDVSYDGRKIVFAGFSSQGFVAEDKNPMSNPNGWRLYVINADGTDLKQLTKSDLTINYTQFGDASGGLQKGGYDDTDPAWLPDGRIVFTSTRWPSFAQYGGARTSNLHVVNADGTGMHRITAERNGADRPVVNPSTGQIVFSRWWRNMRFATNNMSTIASSQGGYVQKDGLTSDRGAQLGGFDFLFRNNWHLATINPDGTELGQWAGPHNRDDGVHAYGAAFAGPDEIVANYFPMTNMTEAGGFGGLRRYHRRQTEYESIMGVTKVSGLNLVSTNPPSYGVLKSEYVSDAAPLVDGRMVVSIAPDHFQDYALYLVDRNGQNRTLLYNGAGTTELRAKLLQARPLPPILPDTTAPLTTILPPKESGPYDVSGTFVFDALNVYANGPVDTIDASAPKVGSASKIRFFADFQRTSAGSFETLDWPILLSEKTINPDGSVREPNAPAGIPLFEQIRSADGTVPFTTGSPGGAAHVAGMNFGMPGNTSRCVGCHSGHTQIPVSATDEEAKWSNLAPGADIRVSTSRNSSSNKGLTDRRVNKGQISDYWYSANNATANQWVELTFPQPVTVRTVRVYNPRFTNGSTLQVNAVTVRLSLPGVSGYVDSKTSGPLAVTGTNVTFADVRAQTVRVELGALQGKAYDGAAVASLAEIEVIARAGNAAPSGTPTVQILTPVNGATVNAGAVSFTGTATDPQEGSISSKIVWRSSIAGEIGRGAAINPTLAAGTHTISAMATDTTGASGSASITLVVKAVNTNAGPKVTILKPANGGSVAAGSVSFQATAIDPEDGDITNGIVWQSNLSGTFANGGAPTATLSAGTHTITALSKDSGGKTSTAVITLTVAPAGNTQPKVSILSPANWSRVSGLTTFTALATDAEDGDISANVHWHSHLMGVFGQGKTVTKQLTPGRHHITALVSDSKGRIAGAVVIVVAQ